MNDPNLDLPGRLKVVGATDLERRFLTAAAREQPSAELRKRMAVSIGISAAVLGATAADSALSVTAADSALGATMTGAKAAGISFLTPWITAGVLGLTLTGIVVGVGLWKDDDVAPPNQDPAISRTLPAPPIAAESTATIPSKLTPESDLREQIALVDNARTAVTAGAGHRALEILRRYQNRFPQGSFQPEVQALRIEALAKLGRMTEARTLAKQFVATHRNSPLADRVARTAGLIRP